MDELREKPVGQPGKRAGKLVDISILLGTMPVFAQMFGFQFMPSPEWAKNAFVPGIAGGLLGAILLPRIILRGIGNSPGSGLKKICAVLGCPFIGFLMGRNLIVITGPMILALITGHQTELTYVVDNASRSGSRGCRSAVPLQGLPFLLDKLCGVQNEFKQGLAEGSQIVVTGHGTSFGIFPDGMRRFD